MARVERAHPEHPDFRKGKKAYKRFVNRYKQCLPYVGGKTVLDVPCGVGWGTSMFKAAKEVHGLDNDEGSIAYGREHYPGLQLQVGTMLDMPYMSDYFGAVICLEGYEHVGRADQQLLMGEIKRVLKVGGTLVMTIPLAGHSKGKNPYHLYEPTMDEMCSDLIGFEAIDMQQIGTVLWFVGKRV